MEALLRWDYDGCRSVCIIIQLSGKSIMAAVEPTVEVGKVSFWLTPSLLLQEGLRRGGSVEVLDGVVVVQVAVEMHFQSPMWDPGMVL